MFDFLCNSFDCAAIKAIFAEYSPSAQDRFMQRVYDSGVFVAVIAKALNISDVYDQIDAYLGRGPASRPA